MGTSAQPEIGRNCLDSGEGRKKRNALERYRMVQASLLEKKVSKNATE